MTYSGDYDPTGFDPATPSTWPGYVPGGQPASIHVPAGAGGRIVGMNPPHGYPANPGPMSYDYRIGLRNLDSTWSDFLNLSGQNSRLDYRITGAGNLQCRIGDGSSDTLANSPTSLEGTVPLDQPVALRVHYDVTSGVVAFYWRDGGELDGDDGWQSLGQVAIGAGLQAEHDTTTRVWAIVADEVGDFYFYGARLTDGDSGDLLALYSPVLDYVAGAWGGDRVVDPTFAYLPRIPNPTCYDAGEWWYLTAPATIPAQPVIGLPATDVDVGDRLYAVGFGRTYGDDTYGGAVYGGPLESPWCVDDGATIAFRPWQANDSTPWDRPAPPYAGCPFGERAPGYRLVVEALVLDPAVQARTYGTDDYGDALYGDVLDVARREWIDITRAGFSIVVRRGGDDGNPVVPVDELTVDVTDPDATAFPFATPMSWYAPDVGTMARVSLLDPQGAAHPVAVARVERIDDEHDAPPRVVLVEAYGLQFDEAHALPTFNRPAEDASTRLAALQTAAGWQWAPELLTPSPGNTLTAADRTDVGARAEFDRVALSAGWVADVDVAGRLRFREWPLVGDGPPIVVADCDHLPGELRVERLRFVADTAETVNYVSASTLPEPADPPGVPYVSTRTDDASIARIGRREGLGFPVGELSAAAPDLDALTARTVARYGRVTTRVAEVEVDTLRDPRWLDVLADLDTGRVLVAHRRAFPAAPLTLTGVVVGFEHRLTPNRWRATLYLTTTTPTL